MAEGRCFFSFFIFDSTTSISDAKSWFCEAASGLNAAKRLSSERSFKNASLPWRIEVGSNAARAFGSFAAASLAHLEKAEGDIAFGAVPSSRVFAFLYSS